MKRDMIDRGGRGYRTLYWGYMTSGADIIDLNDFAR